jgi:hypothetical protein
MRVRLNGGRQFGNAGSPYELRRVFGLVLDEISRLLSVVGLEYVQSTLG